MELLIAFIEKFDSVPGYIWGVWVFFVSWSLYFEGKGRDRFLTGMNGKLNNVYRNRLATFLDWTAQRWFKDRQMLEQRRLEEGEHRLLGVNAFTNGSFELSLRLALVYPLLAVFLVWVISGQGGSIGTLEIFAPLDSDWRRILSFLLAIGSAWAFWMSMNFSGWKGRVYVVALILFAIIGASLGSSAFLSITSLVLALAFVIAVAIAIVVAFSRTGAFASMVAFAGVFLFVVIFTVFFDFGLIGIIAIVFAYAAGRLLEKLYYIAKHRCRLSMYWLFYVFLYFVLTIILVILFAQKVNIVPETFSLLLLLSLLPLLNVPLDWLSLGVTRSLLYAIADKVHSGFRAFLWAVFDGVLALGFLLLITVVIVFALAAMNGLSAHFGGVQILDLRLIFDGLSVDPWRKCSRHENSYLG